MKERARENLGASGRSGREGGVPSPAWSPALPASSRSPRLRLGPSAAARGQCAAGAAARARRGRREVPGPGWGRREVPGPGGEAGRFPGPRWGSGEVPGPCGRPRGAGAGGAPERTATGRGRSGRVTRPAPSASGAGAARVCSAEGLGRGQSGSPRAWRAPGLRWVCARFLRRQLESDGSLFFFLRNKAEKRKAAGEVPTY